MGFKKYLSLVGCLCVLTAGAVANKTGLHKCGNGKLVPDKQVDPTVTRNVLNVGLDRGSFLRRGYTNQQLGGWQGGNPASKRGVFLSLFYALQLNNPNERNNPWNENENVENKFRGLGAIIDSHAKAQYGPQKAYFINVFDNDRLEGLDAVIVGRNLDEAPFNDEKQCKDGLGCAAPGQKNIYIRADANWTLGLRLDKPYYARGTTATQVNLTHVLAHQVLHFLGFPHQEAKDSILYPGEEDERSQSFDSPKEIQDLFRKFVASIFG